MKKYYIIFCCFFLFLSFSSFAEEALNMKPNINIGDKFIRKMEIVNIADIKTPAYGSLKAENKFYKIDISQTVSLTVKNEGKEDGYELELEILNLKIVANTSAGKKVFDSDMKTTFTELLPGTYAIDGVKGAKIKYIVNNDGILKSMENYDKFIEWINIGSPPEMKSLTKGIFNESSMKKMLNQFYLQKAPFKDIKTGESWNYTEENTLQSYDVIIYNSTAIFKNWDNILNKKTALIETSAKITNKPDAKSTIVEIKNSKINGKIWFDPILKTPQKIESEQEFVYDFKTYSLKEQADIPSLTTVKQNVVSTLSSYSKK